MRGSKRNRPQKFGRGWDFAICENNDDLAGEIAGIALNFASIVTGTVNEAREIAAFYQRRDARRGRTASQGRKGIIEMKRHPCQVRQTDVARAVKGALAAGMDVEKVELQPDGRITIMASRHDEQAPTAGKNERDDL